MQTVWKILKLILLLAISFVVVCMLFSCRHGKAVAVRAPEQRQPSQSLREAEFTAIFIDACAERMKGNLHQALKLLDQCAAINPRVPALAYEFSTIYKLLGDGDKAVQFARYAAETEPANEWFQQQYIEALIGARQYRQAIRVREELVRKFPERTDFKEDLAIDYAMTGDLNRSIRIYNELEQTYGINEQLVLNKVKLLKEQGRNAEVERELLKLRQSAPEETRYAMMLAEFYTETRQFEKAKAIYDEVVAKDPLNASMQLALHDYYTRQRDPARAFTHLQQAFRSPELEVSVKAGILGKYYEAAEQGDSIGKVDGMKLSQIFLTTNPAAPASNALHADFLKLDGRNGEASVYYYRAAVAEKRDYRVWENLLYLDNQLSRYDSLLRHSTQALELFPSQPRLYLYKGLAADKTGNSKDAVTALREGMEFVVDNQSLKLDFLRLMGDAAERAGDHRSADKAFTEALKIDPDNAYVLNNFAYYLAERNERLDEAAQYAKHALQLQPANANYMDTYGWVLFRKGDFLQSVEWLQKAAASGHAGPTVLEHYGDALYKLGRAADAVAQWKAARTAGNKTERLQKKINTQRTDD